MNKAELIEGFSKLKREEKISIISRLLNNDSDLKHTLNNHLHPEAHIQEKYQEFSENTISNYFLPYSIAPNFLIDGRVYHVPMVIEESSVVAAAASAAKFWAGKGGFNCEVINTIKTGQIHFKWRGDAKELSSFFYTVEEQLYKSVENIAAAMQKRGGGIRGMKLRHIPDVFSDYYKIDLSFDTVDSMGANFINTCLEHVAQRWKELLESDTGFGKQFPCTIIMSILSNYTPECIVKCRVSDKIDEKGVLNKSFCENIVQAVHIAEQDVYRSVTHNKGIFNGVDAVILATGNDFRAVEANAHAYAARSGKYTSLSKAWIERDVFSMELEIPLAIGTVGGLTQVHPLARKSLEILGMPSAGELMKIAASAGLANNFSALKSLTTIGIQQGHMKLHITNILTQLQANKQEKAQALEFFKNQVVSFRAVQDFLNKIRN